MKKSKIIFVNGHMQYGGVEKSLLSVLQNLDYRKYDVDLLLIEGKGEYYNQIPHQVKVLNKNLKNTHGSFINSIKNSFKERDLLSIFAKLIFISQRIIHPSMMRLLKYPLSKFKKYDFAIAFRPGLSTSIVEYAVNSKEKTSWWHHGEMNLSDSQLKEFEKTCKKFKKLVVVSKSSKELLSQHIPSIKKYITVIPNMIDVKDILNMSKELKPNFDKTKMNFVTVCRISPEKHIENVIYSSELLLQRGFKNFDWYVIGDGEELEKMKELSKSKKTTENVHFEGRNAKPYAYMKHADLYIHTSYIESQGLSILEAMSLKTPCIITDNAGIREYANKENSMIIEKGATHISDAIIRIANDKELYRTLKQNTKCPVRFDSNHIMKLIDQFLSNKILIESIT